MATVSSPDARGGSPAERFKWVRELGSCAVPTWAALESSGQGRAQLVVAERMARTGAADDPPMADALARARSLATLRHANVGRVREVVLASAEVLVVREFIDGVAFRELADAPQRPPLEITLRALVDVLSGLAGVHGLRGEGGQGPNMFHGQLTPDCIFVTPAGAARVVVASRLSVGNRLAKESYPYLAPELLLEDDEADARSDVYGVGVMLWEALSGRSLFGGMQPSAIVTHLLSGRVTRATTPADAPWAAPLADVAVRALMPEASKRFQSAAAMAAEIRRVAAGRVALTGRVAAHMGATYGDVVRKRREELEQGRRAPSKAPIPVVELAAGDITEEPPLSSHSRPTPIVPPPFPPRAPRPQAASSAEATIATATAPMAFEPIPVPPPVQPRASEPAAAPPPPLARAALEPIATQSRDELVAASLASAEPDYAPRRPKPYLTFALIGVVVVAVVGVALWLAAPTRDTARPSAAPPSQARAAIAPPVSGPASAQPVSGQAIAQPVSDPATAPLASGAASALPDSSPAPEATIESPPGPPPSPPASAVVAPATTPESARPAPLAPTGSPSPAVRLASPPTVTSAPARSKHKYDPEGI